MEDFPKPARKRPKGAEPLNLNVSVAVGFSVKERVTQLGNQGLDIGDMLRETIDMIIAKADRGEYDHIIRPQKSA